MQRQRSKTSVSGAVECYCQIGSYLRGVTQNASHEPRNSVCQVLSQDPSEMRGRLKDSPIVCLWVPISSQDLKAIPLQQPINLCTKSFKWDSQAR